MKVFTLLKMIVRSWWRNKVFFLVSIFSLAIGLACTNLLFTYFVHDYNVESGNKDKDRMFFIRQDNPMVEGSKAAYARADIPLMLKEKYAEVDNYLRINTLNFQCCKYKQEVFKDFTFICADTTLLSFFHYHLISGHLDQALKEKDKVAVNAKFAEKLFGKDDPLGKMLEMESGSGYKSFEVVAVLDVSSQSLLQFDILTGIDETFDGGITLLKLSSPTVAETLATKINRDKIPTLMPGKTHYYIDPLSSLYFFDSTKDVQQPLPFIKQSNAQLLFISLFAALLIFAIACCNYTNMSLSRLLQQLKMIYVEKLVGSSLKEIRFQLFGDAFLTVMISFVLSLLLINDFLSLFNEFLGSQMDIRFFFSLQMLPLLILFALFMSILPAWYVSLKLSRMSFSEYKTFNFEKKQRFVTLLIIVQYVISIGLLFATSVVREQIKLIQSQAYCYENRIEIGGDETFSGVPLKEELKKCNGVESIALSQGSILNSWMRELQIKQNDGTEKSTYLLMIHTDTDFLLTMGLTQVAGNSSARFTKEYAFPALINESYVRDLVPNGVNPIGRSLKEFDPLEKSPYVIAGVVNNFPINSLENEITPVVLYFSPKEEKGQTRFLQIKLNAAHRKEALKQIEAVWKKITGKDIFEYTDMHEEFMKRNNKVIAISNILAGYSVIGLLLTCFGLFGMSWYAVRKRIREISIRKIHGATLWQIVWLLNKPVCLQITIAYVLATPLTYWLTLGWRQQFAYQASLTVADFLLPLLIVWFISAATVCVQAFLLNKAKPTDCLKIE